MRIGVDLGGTKIEIVALAEEDQIVLSERVPTPRDGYVAICQTIAALVIKLEHQLGQRATVGIGIPGTIAPATGRIKNANTVCLNGQLFRHDMEVLLGRTVRSANDANCFIASEAADGAAAGADSAFGVIIGTGTGGGLYGAGAVVVGANGIAGEWGHNPAPWLPSAVPPRPCYCGRRDCIETYLCGAGLTRTCHELGALRFETVEAIALAAQRDDTQAGQTLAVYADQLACALGTVINTFDPAVIVLGGGLSKLPDLPREVSSRLAPYVFSDTLVTRVVSAVHGDSSGVRGAARLWSLGEARACG